MASILNEALIELECCESLPTKFLDGLNKPTSERIWTDARCYMISSTSCKQFVDSADCCTGRTRSKAAIKKEKNIIWCALKERLYCTPAKLRTLGLARIVVSEPSSVSLQEEGRIIGLREPSAVAIPVSITMTTIIYDQQSVLAVDLAGQAGDLLK